MIERMENIKLRIARYRTYCGGTVPSDLGGDVKVIYSTSKAFAALKGDGTVRAWGSGSCGGAVPSDLGGDVKVIFGSTTGYSDSTSMHHYPCPLGQFGPGFSDCEACPEGAPVAPAQRNTFSLGIRSVKGSCVTCPSPTFSEDGASCGDSCANGFTYYAPTYFGDTASGCHACEWAREGTYYNTTTKKCQLCAPGKYAAAGSTLACDVCPVGKYTAFSGSDACFECNTNFTTPSAGSLSGSVCYRVCAAGEYGTRGDTTLGRPCRKCAGGKYSSASAYACTDCAAGSYSGAGAPACTLCGAGTFRAEEGKPLCEKCGVDQYSNFTGATACTACRPGTGTNGTTNNTQSGCMNKGLYEPCGPGEKKEVGTGHCIHCETGTYSELGDNTCTPCAKGSYTATTGSAKCQLCKAGKYGNVTGANSNSFCHKCEAGSYNSFDGASACQQCPPGSACKRQGMDQDKQCASGAYALSTGSTSCSSCAAGRYQSNPGQAVCKECPAGKYGLLSSRKSEEDCLDCPAGRYSSSKGATACSQCGRTQYQTDIGQAECDECSGAGQIGSADGTTCVVDSEYADALAAAGAGGPTIIETLYKKGAALIGAFLVTVIFTAVVGAMQYKKLGCNKAAKDSGYSDDDIDGDKVAMLPPHQVAMKASLTGFSFGSELFLIITMLGKAPGLAAVMIVFRLSHVVVAGTFAAVLFGSSGVPAWLEDKGVVKKATTLSSLLCEDFCRANMPLLSGVVLLSMGDCSMMQFLPWKASRVYAESQGFPSLQLLRWCLGTDTVQATVSVMCQIIFLTTSAGKEETDESGQAKALFAMNITFAVLGSVSGLLTLCLKDSLLSRLESGEEGGDNKNRGAGRSASEAKDRPVANGSGVEEGKFGVANLYGNNTAANVVNPMLATGSSSIIGDGGDLDDARTQVLRLNEETAALELKLREAFTENSQLEMKKVKLCEDNARLESELTTTEL